MQKVSNLFQKKIKTTLCDLYLVASENGLCGIHWKEQNISSSHKANEIKSSYIDVAEMQLHEYFAGNRKNFSLILDLEGSVFQLKVWQQLQKIPFGTTISYKTLAQECLIPKGSRAVGNANSKNPLPIVIPCHRVISSCGALGGYSGGLNIKQSLLAIENKNSIYDLY